LKKINPSFFTRVEHTQLCPFDGHPTQNDIILSSRLQNVAAGLGSRMCGGRSASSCGADSSSDDDLRLKRLPAPPSMLLTGELLSELRSMLLERDDEDDMDRRNEVRRLCGEKREVMDWKREVCMVPVGRVVMETTVCGVKMRLMVREGDVVLIDRKEDMGIECKVRHSLV
jgi:hypothetical protein